MADTVFDYAENFTPPPGRFFPGQSEKRKKRGQAFVDAGQTFADMFPPAPAWGQQPPSAPAPRPDYNPRAEIADVPQPPAQYGPPAPDPVYDYPRTSEARGSGYMPTQRFPAAPPDTRTKYYRAPQVAPEGGGVGGGVGMYGRGFSMPGRVNAQLSRFFGTDVGRMGGFAMNKAMQDEYAGEDAWRRRQAAEQSEAAIRQFSQLAGLNYIPQQHMAEMLKSLGPWAGMAPVGSAARTAYDRIAAQLGLPTGAPTAGVPTGGGGGADKSGAQALGSEPQTGQAPPQPSGPEKGRGAMMAGIEGALPGIASAAPWLLTGMGGPWGIAGKIAMSAVAPYLMNMGIKKLDPLADVTREEHPLATGAGNVAGFVGGLYGGGKVKQYFKGGAGGGTNARTETPPPSKSQPSAPPASTTPLGPDYMQQPVATPEATVEYPWWETGGGMPAQGMERNVNAPFNPEPIQYAPWETGGGTGPEMVPEVPPMTQFTPEAMMRILSGTAPKFARPTAGLRDPQRLRLEGLFGPNAPMP